MAKTLRVKAGANGPVFLPAPIQGVRTIENEWVEVESTRFIRRRIEVGDLVQEGADITTAEDTFTPEDTGAQDVHARARSGVTTRRTIVPGKES
jgi:hypothetical protein